MELQETSDTISLASWLRPAEEKCSNFCLNSWQAVEQFLSADLSLTPCTEETYWRTLSSNCQSATFIVGTLFTVLVPIPEKPDLPIITGTGPGEARRGGKTLCAFRSGSFCVRLAPWKSHRDWASFTSVPRLSPLFPREIVGKLSSFSPKSLRFSKPDLSPGSHNETNTWNGTGTRAQVGYVKGRLLERNWPEFQSQLRHLAAVVWCEGT